MMCLDVKEGENIAFYAGDSEGSTLEFKAPEEWRTKDCVFSLAKKEKCDVNSNIKALTYYQFCLKLVI